MLRASLGRPRRLSLRFLWEERVRLETWRRSVRSTYAANMDTNEEPPADMPRQPQVGGVGAGWGDEWGGIEGWFGARGVGVGWVG